jgi:hypothetical protein
LFSSGNNKTSHAAFAARYVAIGYALSGEWAAMPRNTGKPTVSFGRAPSARAESDSAGAVRGRSTGRIRRRRGFHLPDCRRRRVFFDGKKLFLPPEGRGHAA